MKNEGLHTGEAAGLLGGRNRKTRKRRHSRGLARLKMLRLAQEPTTEICGKNFSLDLRKSSQKVLRKKTGQFGTDKRRQNV